MSVTAKPNACITLISKQTTSNSKNKSPQTTRQHLNNNLFANTNSLNNSMASSIDSDQYDDKNTPHNTDQHSAKNGYGPIETSTTDFLTRMGSHFKNVLNKKTDNENNTQWYDTEDNTSPNDGISQVKSSAANDGINKVEPSNKNVTTDSRMRSVDVPVDITNTTTPPVKPNVIRSGRKNPNQNLTRGSYAPIQYTHLHHQSNHYYKVKSTVTKTTMVQDEEAKTS